MNPHVPSASRGTLFTESPSTEFTAQESGTVLTNHFTAVIALVHFVTELAVKSFASIADSDFVVGLVLVTPVAVAANVIGTSFASHLHVFLLQSSKVLFRSERREGLLTMQASGTFLGVVIIVVCCLGVVVVAAQW